ncbi:uncharacterized protein MELLADRAFT_85866 [Melampsora larici-populina 98AG31]|uniref:GCM domain-containing protein n=1 Tax=Melampsora larici-populina (strain 98AG31 / pathotype 3-4-7) TaxID=747676 RepID=F4SDF4_MELLP|nr:uncharacterized protein MELLADRAFT_85866 [Melampsora larici-populina 98AG31]EGF97323.1 hypothetical protein MELLADRAFT_85866 [Melampsora larici-populina 98AG31]
MTCSNPDCELQATPATNPKKLAKSVDSPCTISGCDGHQIHIGCHARCRIDQEVDEKDPDSTATWSLLRHQGIHHHPWPDSKKADPISKEKLKDRIIQDPKTGPTSLKNVCGTGYLRRDILITNGLMSDKNDPEGADKWLLAIVHWARACEWYKKKPKPYTGGLLSDVTYQFFENGYLLTTSMYNDKIERWVPVLQTWLHKLSRSHYKAHFVTLLRQIQQSSLSEKDKGLLCEQVVDFSQAQKVGFIDAYMEVFNVYDCVYDCNIALLKLHGCEQHFLQAINRIKKNSSIVKPHLKGLWVTKSAKRWIAWWQTADTQAMLFPAWKQMDLDDPPLDREEVESDPKGKCGKKNKKNKPQRRAELPSTTNAQESMHCVYYMLWANVQ